MYHPQPQLPEPISAFVPRGWKLAGERLARDAAPFLPRAWEAFLTLQLAAQQKLAEQGGCHVAPSAGHGDVGWDAHGRSRFSLLNERTPWSQLRARLLLGSA